MNTIKLNRGQKLVCPDPDCKHVWDIPVEDASIPGRIGKASRATDECEVCYAKFACTEVRTGEFEVELLKKGDA